MKGFGKTVILVLLLLGIGAAASFLIMKNGQKQIVDSRSVIVLDKIDQVMKLVTVEGGFNETYDEDNIKQLTAYFPFPYTFQFTKSAKLSVTGKVLVGYDMEQIEMTLDSVNKVIHLKNLPMAKILAIDHDISYNNLEESWWNTFKAEDFTNLNKNARKVIENHVKESGLMEEAKMQGNHIIDIMNFMAQSAGWTIMVEGKPWSTEDLEG